MQPLLETIAHRPYVLAIVIVFWMLAPIEIGWRRALAWFVSGTSLGWLAEFSSTRTGFPFGHYAYHGNLFPHEPWIGGVPPFASVSFAALTYFGYSSAITLLAPLRRRGADVVAYVGRRLRRSRAALLLGALIPTWLDMTMDPVTHLGRYWMLGDLYHYEDPGLHFHVPLSNYLGWLVTCLAIIAVNQLADRVPARAPEAPVLRDDSAVSTAFALHAPRIDGDTITLSWSSMSGADGYRVRVYGPDLVEIYRSPDVTEASFVLDRTALPSGLPSSLDLTWRVYALSDGDVVGISPPGSIRIP